MISRLRSVGTKTNQERNSFFSKPRPSKEDILNTIDGFSGNLENGAASPDVAEDNNNLTRHSSKDSVNSEPWEIPNIQPMSASYQCIQWRMGEIIFKAKLQENFKTLCYEWIFTK